MSSVESSLASSISQVETTLKSNISTIQSTIEGLNDNNAYRSASIPSKTFTGTGLDNYFDIGSSTLNCSKKGLYLFFTQLSINRSLPTKETTYRIRYTPSRDASSMFTVGPMLFWMPTNFSWYNGLIVIGYICNTPGDITFNVAMTSDADSGSTTYNTAYMYMVRASSWV